MELILLLNRILELLKCVGFVGRRCMLSFTELADAGMKFSSSIFDNFMNAFGWVSALIKLRSSCALSKFQYDRLICIQNHAELKDRTDTIVVLDWCAWINHRCSRSTKIKIITLLGYSIFWCLNLPHQSLIIAALWGTYTSPLIFLPILESFRGSSMINSTVSSLIVLSGQL